MIHDQTMGHYSELNKIKDGMLFSTIMNHDQKWYVVAH